MPMNITKKNIIFIASLFFACFSCVNKKDSGDEIVARVGDEVISADDLDRAIQAVPAPYRFEFTTEQTVYDFLQNMIDEKLMVKEALTLGLKKDNVVNYESQSKDHQVSVGEEQRLINAYIANRLQKLEGVSEEEIKNYYYEHKNEFVLAERIHVKRICFKEHNLAGKAKEALNEIPDMDDLIKEKPQFKRKIDTFWMHRRNGISKAEADVFSLKYGEISNIVETKAGYCLLQVEDKIPASIRPFDEAKEGIKARLESQQRKDALDEMKQELRRKVPIAVNSALLKNYLSKKSYLEK